MARIYSYNIGDYISGTTQYGNICVVTGNVDFDNTNVNWYMGPENEECYLIVGHHPIQDLQFWRAKQLSETSYLDLLKRNFHQIFFSSEDANIWLLNNGYYPIESENIITNAYDFIILNNDNDILIYK